MRYSSATKPVRLLNPWSLLVAAALMAAVLYLLLQGEETFLPDGRTDAVSATYAELLLAAQPQSHKLRKELIQLLIDLGEYDRAQGHIAAWPEPEPLLVDYFNLVIGSLTAIQSGDSATAATAATARQQLQDFDRDTLPPERMLKLTELALALEMPAVAAGIYYQLAHQQQHMKREYLEQAARWNMASVRPDLAGGIFVELLELSDEVDQRRHYLRLAYSSLLAAGETERAVQTLAEDLWLLNDSGDNVSWLEQGKDKAMSALRYDLAEQFIRHWRTLQPQNHRALEAEFRLHLASGDIFSAWQAGELLLVARPEEPELLREMALLGEWNGLNQQALSYWISYLRLQPDLETLDYAWRRAFQMFDYQRGLPLLEQLTFMRRLEDRELDSLIYAHESMGTPDAAEQWLRGYIKRQPGHRLARLRLAQNLENTHQYAAQSQVWSELSARFPLSVAERVEWAGIHWRLFQPRQAWEVLQMHSANIDLIDYWRLRANLAWELEMDDEVQFAYESMLSQGLVLSASEEDQLIETYRIAAPEKALDRLVDRWRRNAQAGSLLEALDLAERLGEWEFYAELTSEAQSHSQVADMVEVQLATATVAERSRDEERAEQVYYRMLAIHPQHPVVRERFLWFLLNHGRHVELAQYVRSWRTQARDTANLWLPFAAAAQALGRWDESLAWYQLYLRSNPSSFVVQASYVDALIGAGRVDQAHRLREYLLQDRALSASDLSPAELGTYLRLTGARDAWQAQRGAEAAMISDGSQTMLQMWFDQMMVRLGATNDSGLKAGWIDWARGQGLEVERFEQLELALRQHDKGAVQAMLDRGGLDAGQEVAALTLLGKTHDALSKALESLSSDSPPYQRAQLRAQAVGLAEQHPRGAQIGWESRDYGAVERSGVRLLMASNVAADWQGSIELAQHDYDISSLDAPLPDTESSVKAALVRPLADGAFEIQLDSSFRSDQDRHGISVAQQWRATARDAFDVRLDWNVRSEESGLMRLHGRQSGAALGGQHAATARDQLAWSFARRTFSTQHGESLGAGNAVNVELRQVQQFESPTWVLRTGVDYQRNTLSSRSLAGIGLESGDFLQQDYGRMYVGSLLRRGLPGALNRSRPQYTWLVDVQTGWDWNNQELVYGLNAGLGTSVIGNDELALTVGYQSAPRGGSERSGGTFGISYGMRFGR